MPFSPPLQSTLITSISLFTSALQATSQFWCLGPVWGGWPLKLLSAATHVRGTSSASSCCLDQTSFSTSKLFLKVNSCGCTVKLTLWGPALCPWGSTVRKRLFVLEVSWPPYLHCRCQGVNTHRVYPWVHQYSNLVSSESQVAAIRVPDVNPSDFPSLRNFSMSAGDFLEVYTIPGMVEPPTLGSDIFILW